MNEILFLTGLEAATLGIAALCALSGSYVLTRYARPFGRLSYAVNFLMLFAGAVAACVILSSLGWRVDYSLERQLLGSFLGIGAVACVTLMLHARSPHGG